MAIFHPLRLLRNVFRSVHQCSGSSYYYTFFVVHFTLLLLAQKTASILFTKQEKQDAACEEVEGIYQNLKANTDLIVLRKKKEQK